MSDGRRFNESEIREVFERAAREQEHASRRASQEGLTLEEMQEIAASAGIAPEFVAAAARSVALGEPETGRTTTLGIPVGVYRTERLPGPPTDALWDELVSDLRRTFAASGKVTASGRVREWRNGNLRATLEPAAEGSRLVLRTRRSGTSDTITLAAVAVALGLVVAVLSAVGVVGVEAAAAWVWAAGGLVGGAALWNGQRNWAATRERQMAEVAERAVAASQEGAPAVLGALTPAPSSPLAASGQIDLDALGLEDLDAPGPEAVRDRRRNRS